jgi:glycosyltransferase involved in cell wall biosynthesis
MRVLLISHTCQSRTEGQPKAQELSRIGGVELQLLVPDRWMHHGASREDHWRVPDRPDHPDFLYLEGKVALPWAGPAQFYLHWYPELKRILRDFKPDIIDLWEESWGLCSAHACWLRNRVLPGAKIVLETEQNLNRRLPPPFELFRSYSLRNADWVIGRSEQAVQVAREKGYRGPATVVPNAVDAELFRPMDREACRRDLKLSGFVVGYVGRLVERKGLMDAIEAIKRCPEPVNLLLAGSGPQREELEGRAKALGVTGRVRFVAGMAMEEVPRLMNALDVLILPSRTIPTWKEQFGRVIIEAHACGIPVIGSDSGAIPEVIGPGGLTFPEGQIVAFAEAIMTLATNAAKATDLGRIGRERVGSHFTWRPVAERVRNVYQQVMGDISG